MAAEILCTRWTVVLLRELVAGSTRFNELRRGLPRMSPALLSKRLKDLEAAGLITRTRVANEPGVYEYHLTQSGSDLAPVVNAIGVWGHTWIKTKASLQNLDPNLLMWDMRRNINPDPMPRKRTVVQVIFTDLPAAQKNWWLLIEPDEGTDLCSVDPGFDVDLYISTDLRTMTAVWMGYLSLARAMEEGRMTLTGDRKLGASIGSWMMRSPFAKVERKVA
jgi:DNA-binding HxlR family transcriptional regulator